MSAPGLALFALDGSREFGERVARELGIGLAAHEEREFEDGEHKARSLEGVRGRHACAILSLHGGARLGPNDRLLRLAFFAGSLRDAGAARVTVVAPYLAYSRKDRRTKPRDPVTTRYVARLFESVGADDVLTLDVHNLAAFENAFRCRAENLEAAGVLAARVAAIVGEGSLSVVSPDAGGVARAERLRERLAALTAREVEMAFVPKRRSEGVLTSGAVVGEVAGRTAVIVDDIVASGGTLARAAESCLRAGAARVIAAAAHGLFSGGAREALGAGPIDRIVVTDSADIVPDAAFAARVERASVAPLFARAIACLRSGGSLSELARSA